MIGRIDVFARAAVLVALVVGVLGVRGVATAADPVWPPAVRYEALLQLVELVAADAPIDAAAIDDAYRAYLVRSGELRVGLGRARDELDRMWRASDPAPTVEEFERTWRAVEQAEARVALAETELAARVRELLPRCEMSPSSLALHLRLADAFGPMYSSSPSFTAILALRPAAEDRAAVMRELETLLPAAQRLLRDLRGLAAGRTTTWIRFIEEYPMPAADDPAAQDAWQARSRERLTPMRAALESLERTFAERADAAFERLIATTSQPTRRMLEDGWRKAVGGSDPTAILHRVWRVGAGVEDATIADARARAIEFLRSDAELDRRWRRLVREERARWLRMYVELPESPTAAEIVDAEQRSYGETKRLAEARDAVHAERVAAVAAFVDAMRTTLAGDAVEEGNADVPIAAGGSSRFVRLVPEELLPPRPARRLVEALPRTVPTTLPHRWRPPAIDRAMAGAVARRLGRDDAAPPIAAAIEAFELERNAVVVDAPRELALWALAPDEAEALRTAVDAAFDRCASARAGFVDAVRAVARDDRERAIVDAALVEHLGGDPIAATMSRSLQPWGAASDQRARRGSPVWALERAGLERSGLDGDDLDRGRAVVHRFADALIAATIAYDREEVDAIIDACSWPRTAEEAAPAGGDGDAMARRLEVLGRAIDRLDAAAEAREAVVRSVRAALRAELSREGFDLVERTELRSLDPEVATATAAYLERLERTAARASERDSSVLACRDRAIDEATRQDDALVRLSWRPRDEESWATNTELEHGSVDRIRGVEERELRRWLLFARDEARTLELTSIARRGGGD
jgi:hypothetical protein